MSISGVIERQTSIWRWDRSSGLFVSIDQAIRSVCREPYWFLRPKGARETEMKHLNVLNSTGTLMNLTHTVFLCERSSSSKRLLQRSWVQTLHQPERTHAVSQCLQTRVCVCVCMCVCVSTFSSCIFLIIFSWISWISYLNKCACVIFICKLCYMYQFVYVFIFMWVKFSNCFYFYVIIIFRVFFSGFTFYWLCFLIAQMVTLKPVFIYWTWRESVLFEYYWDTLIVVINILN